MEYSENDTNEFAQWKLNRDAALEAHRKHHDDSRDLFRASIDFGLETIRTTALINGGAVVVCLAFVGAIYTSDRPVDQEVISSLLEAAKLFVIGAVLAGLASGCAYWAQRMYTEAHDLAILVWERPYAVGMPERERAERWGQIWHVWTVCAVVASYVLIFMGVSTAIPPLVK